MFLFIKKYTSLLLLCMHQLLGEFFFEFHPRNEILHKKHKQLDFKHNGGSKHVTYWLSCQICERFIYLKRNKATNSCSACFVHNCSVVLLVLRLSMGRVKSKMSRIQIKRDRNASKIMWLYRLKNSFLKCSLIILYLQKYL